MPGWEGRLGLQVGTVVQSRSSHCGLYHILNLWCTLPNQVNNFPSSSKLNTTAVVYMCIIQAWIPQLVAHRLGTTKVVCSNSGKGESLFLTRIWVCLDSLSRVSTQLALWHMVDMLHQDPEHKNEHEILL